jgi:thiopeptide-type bacteriocin biosynthesis protein
MPADRLTLSSGLLAARVEAILAGTALARSAVDGLDLTDAVETYRAAGRAALQRRDEHGWFQARITPAEWGRMEATFAERVAPRLDQLDNGHAAWWFLRKHPDWRLRVRTDHHHAVAAVLDDLVTAGTIGGWRPGIYEPETAAFGGDLAMTVVHDLFCADSRGVLTYAVQQTPELGRRELSLVLIRALQQHAGLDWFEAGDVFDRVAQMRPRPAEADVGRVLTLATRMRPLLSVEVRCDMPLFASTGPVAFAAPWLAAFIDTGWHLGDAAATGSLDRGLRSVLAQIVIFHWNRLGLSAHAQGILAHAAKAAVLPRS